MADHKHGSMDIKVQEDTYNGFISFVTKAVVAIIVAVILLAFINV